METTHTLITYLIYLPVVILLTLYVARTLFRNARIFMLDIFNGRTEIALSTNKLFEMGFYLLNIGFALMIMPVPFTIMNYRELTEVLSSKLGGYSIYLGIILFLNLYMFFRGKRVSRENKMRANIQQDNTGEIPNAD